MAFQTVLLPAFWNSVRHANPFTIGFNCALGADAMRPHLQEVSGIADTFVCAYPNAGLPNEFGQYDQSPDDMARQVREFAKEGLINVVGGCCGSTPEHIRAIAETVKEFAPRQVPPAVVEGSMPVETPRVTSVPRSGDHVALPSIVRALMLGRRLSRKVMVR